MEVILAKEAGFCFGVRDAIKIAKETAKKEKKVYTLGPLIHNPQMVAELENMGIEAIDDLSKVKGTLVIRAHGVPQKTIDRAKKMGINVVDGTCSLVKAVHISSKKLEDEGYQVVIFGQIKHPEVIGIAGNLNNPIIVEDIEDAKKILYIEKIGIVSQTTQMLDSFYEICEELKKHCKELKIQNTICHPTKIKQKSAKELSSKVDLMVVIGGRNSSNTIKLAKICAENTETKHIEEASEIRRGWFVGKNKIGVTAGASTPDYIINSVIEKIKSYNNRINGI